MPRVIGGRVSTYLLLNGIKPSRAIKLSSDIDLLPVPSIPNPDLALDLVKGIDLHFVALFMPWTEAQIKVKGTGAQNVSIKAWNALWDVLLLNAIFNYPITNVLQSSTAVERITKRSKLNVVHHQFFDNPGRLPPLELSEEQSSWLEQHFENAQNLLDDHRFQTAIHCLSTHRWHSHPRAQLALLWAGIESLFNVDSEIVFRVSLYTAKLLSPTDQAEQKAIFNAVRELYKSRSQAVHGGKMKGDPRSSVQRSSELLSRLIRICIEQNALPDVQGLVP